MNALDRAILAVAPGWAVSRLRARAIAAVMARHYEAATVGRRTEGWTRSSTDANAANRPALVALREHARDLVRNNSWAAEGLRCVVDNTVGWGIQPKALGPSATEVTELWERWADSTDCDADGRLSFYGLQALALRTVVEAGEVLIRRRRRRLEDGLPIPLQIQVLEPDFIDTTRDGTNKDNGNAIVQGVEFDRLGRRAAYWLYEQHPGSAQNTLSRGNAFASRRISADDIRHVFLAARPGQVRGVSWFAPAIVNLKDFDEYEDASLLQAKVASLFVASVTDLDGAGAAIGEPSKTNPLVETLEPGMILNLPPGRDVKFGTPPVASDNGFSARTLRRIASGLGVTYEDLTGDYSQVNFSSARMGRLKHWAHVDGWRWNMLIPQLCSGVWGWAMEAAAIAGLIEAGATPRARWTPPPMPMIEPDKEGLALARLVRAGAMTHDEMVRERGFDPETHWAEYAAALKKLDELGIVLDSDVRRVSQAGLTQERVGAAKKGGDAGSGAEEE